jgi:hypothetical protein
MMLPTDQALSVSRIIQLMLSPAVMISGCALLLISSNGRYTTVLERIRFMIGERRRILAIDAAGEALPVGSMNPESAWRQINSLSVRLKYVKSSILSYTTAISLFVAASLLTGIALVSGSIAIQYISTAAFLAGMLTVFVGAAFGVLESRKGYNIVQLEIKEEE